MDQIYHLCQDKAYSHKEKQWIDSKWGEAMKILSTNTINGPKIENEILKVQVITKSVQWITQISENIFATFIELICFPNTLCLIYHFKEITYLNWMIL